MSDVIPSTLPKDKTPLDLADEMIARFPNMDRNEVMRRMIAGYFLDFRHGNKREVRAAAEFLNYFQDLAQTYEKPEGKE